MTWDNRVGREEEWRQEHESLTELPKGTRSQTKS